MLTAEGCAARRARLWGALSAPCDLLVVGDPSHLIYFAGYTPSPFVFRTMESAALLVLEPGSATLVADNLLTPYLQRAFVDQVDAPVWYDGQRAAPHRRSRLIGSTLQRLAQQPAARLARVGIELASVPSGVIEGLRRARPDVEIQDISAVIRPLRRSKDPDELALIRRAIQAGEAAHAAALAQVQPGMTELDVYRLVQTAAIAALGEPAIVYGDFVSGPRCAVERGGPPSLRVIAPGDLLLLDFSVIVSGYRGDFTNTFAVGAAPSERQRAMFDACVGALRAGEALLKPGTPARAVDAAVRSHFASLGLDAAFTTHTGHGIGLGHPEPPYLVPESDETLQAGDVVAVEPGLYIEDAGGMRFERNYLITADGFETLSNHELRIAQ
jgi:Xaa-Pro aminopeptidase